MQDQDKNQDKKPDERFKKWNLVSLAFELGFIIALPILVFGLIGKWIDGRVGNEFPAFTLIGIFAAISATSVWLYRRFREYFK